MPSKKVRSELKNMIIEESLQPGCVVAGLAKQYGISKIPYMAGAAGIINQRYPQLYPNCWQQHPD